MPQDQFGTKIYQGNRVVFKAPNEMLTGIVTLIEEGKISLSAPDGARQRPSHMVIMADIHIYWDPNSNGTIGSVVVAMAQPDVKDLAFSTGPEESQVKERRV